LPLFSHHRSVESNVIVAECTKIYQPIPLKNKRREEKQLYHNHTMKQLCVRCWFFPAAVFVVFLFLWCGGRAVIVAFVAFPCIVWLLPSLVIVWLFRKRKKNCTKPEISIHYEFIIFNNKC
jgi:hypothetical protein